MILKFYHVQAPQTLRMPYISFKVTVQGADCTGGCLFYYNPATSTNQWMLSKPVLLTIGNHSFFK